MSKNNTYTDFTAALEKRQEIHNDEFLENKTVKHLIDSDSEKVADALSDMGFRKFKALNGDGANSLVLYTTSNQIVRISNDNIEKTARVHLPYVLEPIVAKQVGDYRIEVLPKVQVLSELISDPNSEMDIHSYADIIEPLMGEVYNQDQCAGDFDYSNIGIMKDGTPIIIDIGAVWKNPNRPKGRTEFLPSQWVDEDGTWVQHRLYPEILSSQVKGVFGADDMHKLKEIEEGANGSSPSQTKAAEFLRVSAENGAYKGDVAEALLNAAKPKLGAKGARKSLGMLIEASNNVSKQ